MEILDPAPGPDNVKRVSGGGADFCLTSVSHYLVARGEEADLAARFVAIVVQRSPMAALVPTESPLREPSDLPGCRVGAALDSRLVAEFQAGLSHLGLGPSLVVPVRYPDAPLVLARGEVDALPDFVDLLPRVRRQAVIGVRAVPLGLEVYASGLVAADRLSLDLVRSMRAAVSAALQRQRQDPEAGVAELRRRYPQVDVAEALEGWSLVEPNIFTGVEPGSMEVPRWQATITYLSAAHRLPARAETFYRPELVDELRPSPVRVSSITPMAL